MPESIDTFLDDNDELILDKVILKRTTADGHYSYLVLCADGTAEVYQKIEYYKDANKSSMHPPTRQVCYSNIPIV